MSRVPQPHPFAEWAPDASKQSGYAQDAKGVISQTGRYAPLQDLTPYKVGANLASKCIGARGFWDTSGTVHIFAGDDQDLYKLTSRQPAVVSDAGGYTISAVDGWQFEQFGDYIVAVNANVAPQVYQLGVSSVFADLGGTPPTARTAWRVSNQLCLANGRTVSVSGFNDITNWEYATATQGVQFDVDQRGGNIQTGVGGEVGLIFQERGIARMTYIGPPTVFQLDTIEWKHGAISREAVSQYGRSTFYVSETGMLVTDSMSSMPIGQSKIDRYFSNNLNYSARHKVSTAIDFARKLWLVAFPTGSSTEPDHLLIYSMEDNRWTHDEIDTQMLFEMPREGVSIDDVDAITATEGTTLIDDMTVSLDDPKFRETRVQAAAFDGANTLATFEGTNRTATITTSELQPTPLKQTLVDELWPEIDVQTTDVTCFVNTTRNISKILTWGGAHLTWGDANIAFGARSIGSFSSDMNEFGFSPVRISSRYFQMGMTVEPGVEWTEATGMIWRGSAGGER